MTSKTELKRLCTLDPIGMAFRISELEELASCACGDGFTKDAPGKCWICFGTDQTLQNIELSKRVSELESELESELAKLRDQKPVGYVGKHVYDTLLQGKPCTTTMTKHRAFMDDVPLYASPKKD
jgi:hypothetical protein